MCGGRRCAWQGSCMTEGACMAEGGGIGGVCVCVCVAGGMHGGGEG